MKSKVVAEYNLVTEIKKVQEEQRRQIDSGKEQSQQWKI